MNRDSSIQYKKMTETPVSKLIIGLGIPTTISMLITNIYNMADTYFVGTINNSASGAVGVVFGLMAIIQAFGFMYGHGAGSIISRRLGERDIESAGRFASTSFFIALATGILLSILGIIFINPLMLLLGSTETILPYAVGYGIYILLAAPLTMAGFVLNIILRYEGKAMSAMYGLAAGAILNIIGDPIFIFKLNMGIEGAGLSTCLSQTVSFIILLTMFIRGKTESVISIHKIARNPSVVTEIIKTGFPSMLRQGLSSISTMLLNGQSKIYGDAAISAMSIVNRINFFIFAIGLGIGQGFQPVAAFNYGAGKYPRVRKGFKFTFLLGECLLGGLAIIGILLSGNLIGIFRDDAEVIRIGTTALRIQLISLFFQPLSVCSNMTFQSVGKNGMASITATMRSGVFFIPLIIILPKLFGLVGIQASQTIADILSFVVTIPFIIHFFKELPKENDNIG